MVLLSEFRKTFPGALKLRFPSRKKICRIFFWYKIECNSGNYWTSAFLFSVSETSDCWLEPAAKIFQLSGIPDEWQSEIATVLYVRTKNTRCWPSSMSEGVYVVQCHVLFILMFTHSSSYICLVTSSTYYKTWDAQLCATNWRSHSSIWKAERVLRCNIILYHTSSAVPSLNFRCPCPIR